MEVAVEGALVTGGGFQGTLTLTLINQGRRVVAAVRPNPTYPAGTLTFSMDAVGPVSVWIYDLHGRLVRKLDSPAVAAPMRELRLDGRDSRGRPLAAGVYFYRIEAPEGTATGRFVIAR